jgi:methionyl-tRNA formyltransferase
MISSSERARTQSRKSGCKLKFVFAGTPEAALPTLTNLISSQHEILAVITQPPAKSGRGRDVRRSPVHELALSHGIEVLHPASVRDLDSVLRALKPDVIPVVAYGQLIPETMLGIPEHGWINLHFSLLPQWRGAAPVQYSIWHGDSITGATTFRIDKGMDTGPILGQVTHAIDPRDTSGVLLDSLAGSGSLLLRQTLDALESGVIRAIPQQHDLATYAPKISKADSRIEWRSPAIEIDRRIRAMTPTPGAWTMIDNGEDGSTISIAPVLVDRDVVLEPGVISWVDKRVFVGSATYALELSQVKPAGKKFMEATDWLRGLRGVSTEMVRLF